MNSPSQEGDRPGGPNLADNLPETIPSRRSHSQGELHHSRRRTQADCPGGGHREEQAPEQEHLQTSVFKANVINLGLFSNKIATLFSVK